MPYGERNSCSSSMTLSIRRSWSLIDDREQPPLALARRVHAGDVVRQVLAILDEPLQPPLEAWQACRRSAARASPPRTAESARPSTGPSAARGRRPACAARRRRTVFFVPHARAVAAEVIDRVRDVEEVLPELAGDVFVGRIFAAPVPSRWPAGSGSTSPSSRCRRPARCSRRSAAARCGRRRRCCRGRGSRPGRRCGPSLSLRFTHQVKLSSSLWKMRCQERAIAHAAALLLDLVDAPRRPGMHRRIDVAERPFVGGELPVGMHVPLAQHQHELLLGELANRPAPAARSGTPGPTPRTTGYSHLSGIEMTSAL